VEHVIEGLNSIPLGEGTLKVTRATIGLQQQIAIDGGVGAISMLAGATAADTRERSRVICLMNMVTADELLNDDEYDGKS
jgi:splicing factor U2AF subunit